MSMNVVINGEETYSIIFKPPLIRLRKERGCSSEFLAMLAAFGVGKSGMIVRSEYRRIGCHRRRTRRPNTTRTYPKPNLRVRKAAGVMVLN